MGPNYYCGCTLGIVPFQTQGDFADQWLKVGLYYYTYFMVYLLRFNLTKFPRSYNKISGNVMVFLLPEKILPLRSFMGYK